MKQFLAIILSLIVLPLMAEKQTVEKPVEIGIVEHLGDTIPLDLTFYNTENDTVSLRELVDKPTVFSFVYFDCPGLCSPLMSGISDVVGKMDMEIGEEYQVITISFNTKDTPEKAKIKKSNFVQSISNGREDAWIYLTGEQKNIDAVTDALGFKYKPQGLDFAHPSAIILVSPKGKITRYLYGLTYLPFDLKMAVIESQKGLARPTANRVLEYCFAYNPSSQTYVLNITQIVGTIILFLIVIGLSVLLILGRRKTVKN